MPHIGCLFAAQGTGRGISGNPRPHYRTTQLRGHGLMGPFMKGRRRERQEDEDEGGPFCTTMTSNMDVMDNTALSKKNPDTKNQGCIIHLYEMCWTGKSMETASIWCYQGLRRRANGEWLLMGNRFSSGWWKSLELESSGDGQVCEWNKCYQIIHFKLVSYMMWTSASF